MARTRVRGRGTIDRPGHELHGAKVDVLQNAPGGDVIVGVRETRGSYDVGALARV
jgi:hypothetical protein